MSDQTALLLRDFKTYFQRMPKVACIDPEEFLLLFQTEHPGMKKETLDTYAGIIRSLEEDIRPEAVEGLVESLVTLNTGTVLTQLCADWEAGEEPDFVKKVSEIIDQHQRDAGGDAVAYLQPDLKALLEASKDEKGLHWRLRCLQQSMRGLRPGDFGILAGRPGKGKTTFLASEGTYIAAQLPSHHPVLWLNNEGPGERIYLRVIQAALGMTLEEIRKLEDKGTAQAAIKAAIGGLHKVRVVDIHGLDTYAVESIIRDNTPGLVIFDMIDKIHGFRECAREDQTLEEMYTWARELAVKHEFAGIAASQISIEGEHMQFPTGGMLKGSKTGKQGACDFQIMLGSTEDPNNDGRRYIGVVKNKLRLEGKPENPIATVNYRPQIARFEDIPEG